MGKKEKVTVLKVKLSRKRYQATIKVIAGILNNLAAGSIFTLPSYTFEGDWLKFANGIILSLSATYAAILMEEAIYEFK